MQRPTPAKVNRGMLVSVGVMLALLVAGGVAFGLAVSREWSDKHSNPTAVAVGSTVALVAVCILVVAAYETNRGGRRARLLAPVGIVVGVIALGVFVLSYGILALGD